MNLFFIYKKEKSKIYFYNHSIKKYFYFKKYGVLLCVGICSRYVNSLKYFNCENLKGYNY